jgi:hypothetical protein
MGKSEEDQKQAKMLKTELYKSLGSIAKISTGVKMPKAKKPADPFAKKSVFFKNEEMHIKHPNIQKLNDFLMKCHKK